MNDDPIIPMGIALAATIEHQMSPSNFACVERGPKAAADAVLRLLAPMFTELEEARATIARVKALRESGPWIYNDWGDTGVDDEALELALEGGRR